MYILSSMQPQNESAHLSFEPISWPFGLGFCLISVVGIVGNAAIIAALIRNPTLRNRCSYLMGALAAADLLCNLYFIQVKPTLPFEV